ncbi:MAG: EamA family transporter, partial [Quisquiliibacterium sp.]
MPDPAPRVQLRLTSVLLLLAIATVMGGNHVAARLAFDHGTSVSLAVTVRSIGTAIVLLTLLRVSGVPLALPFSTLRRAIMVGLLVSFQSLCLYSAVARIPVALALLVFNTFPIVLGLLSWLTGGERPRSRALVAMPMALTGLAIALDAFGWSGSG